MEDLGMTNMICKECNKTNITYDDLWVIGGVTMCFPCFLVKWTPNVKLNYKDFQKFIGLWGQLFVDKRRTATGPYFRPEQLKHNCNLGIINNLKKEAQELLDNPDIKDNAADCLILLIQLAFENDFDLLEEAKKKMEINLKRKWGEVQEDGVIEHIKEKPLSDPCPACANWNNGTCTKRCTNRYSEGKNPEHFIPKDKK
jgi:hypothetical protein